MSNLSILRIFILTILSLSLHAKGLENKEYIKNFDVDVLINYDNTITVTENIEVNSLQRLIRRGIYRDLPLIRKSQKFGVNTTAFRILSVSKDGQREAYHLKPITNGIRVYIGHKNRYVKKGLHQYQITYQMSRHIYELGELELNNQKVKMSELFWNITGDGWRFPILNSSATFRLAGNNPSELYLANAFTGKYLSKESAVEVEQENGEVKLRTSRALKKKEGWSVAVRFPSDNIASLNIFQRLKQDIILQGIQYKFAGLILLLVALYGLWYVHGIDPQRETIIPRFNPPEDLSPAKINRAYLHRSHNDAIAAAIMNLAVKGKISIEEDSNIILRKKKSEEDLEPENELSKEERALFNNLFSSNKDDDFITLARTNRKTLLKAKRAFEKELGEFSKPLFTYNIPYMILGILLTLTSLYFFSKGIGSFQAGVFIGAVEFSAIGYLLVLLVNSRTTDSKWKKIRYIFPMIFLSIHGGLFSYHAIGISTLYIVLFLLHCLPLGVFLALIPSATKKGQRLIDKIEGFRQYLAIAEKDRLDKLNPPEMTPELFEKFLPYAQALGEEGSWSLRFEKEVGKSLKENHYSPTWYRSNLNNSYSFSSAALAGSLGSSISSAMATSSSSSSSGSGGGGGGGGGGGW